MKTGFLKHFYKDLDNLPNSVKEDIAEIIENVEKVNSIREITGVKKLTGYKNAYRIKFGNYRIGFFFENNIVWFARTTHRKDIYRLFP